MLKSCLIVVLLSCVAQIQSESLPAFVWGGISDGQFPALHSLNAGEFSTFVKTQSNENSLTLVFVENKLSVEDLSQCRLKSQSCFENLQKIEKKTYLTSVDDPVSALKSLNPSNQQKSINLKSNDDLNSKINEIANEKLVFIYLDEVENREDFVKHDELIGKLYNLIASKRGNVIAVYTGRHPSFVYSKPLIRKTRDVSGKQAVDKFADMKFFFNEHVLVALTNASYDNTPLDMASVTVTANDSATNKNQIDAGLKIGDHQIIFNFVLSGGSWEARDITVDGARFVSNVPIDAYGGKSFGCGNVMLTNLQHSLVLNGFQIQPAYDGAEIQKFTADAIFGAHNDCVGFFSPVIWGALFVVFLLLFILSYGFTMIMDIKTMDRFDDPKGKTITINAQE